MSFHRIFICKTCKRIIAGCRCLIDGQPFVEEVIESCAMCYSNRTAKREKAAHREVS